MSNNIPKNKAIDIREIAKMYKEKYNEELPDIVDNLGYIHEMTKKAQKLELPAETAQEPKQKPIYSNKEIERLYNKEFPTEQPKPQPKINEIKRLSRLLQDYRNIK